MKDVYGPEKNCFKALKLLRAHLYNTGVLVLDSITREHCYGDVYPLDLPRDRYAQLVLEEQFFASYVVKDIHLSWDFDKVCKHYLEPAMEDLAKAIIEEDKGLVIFAPMVTIPEDTGKKSFVGTYDNISLRCIVGYDGKKEGMCVKFDTLFATIDLNTAKIMNPLRPAIVCGRVERE